MTAEGWIDEWAPPGLDWQYLASEYPIPAALAAAAAGFWLGRFHGREILGAFAAYAGRQLEELVEREVRAGAGTPGVE